MASFVLKFMTKQTSKDEQIYQIVKDIFRKYDTNRSGVLEK